MQILELLNKATEYLKGKSIESPRNEAEILLCRALDCKRIDLYADFEKIITEDEKEVIRDYLRRRVSGEPLQYITGKIQFRFLDINVEDGVFIPRPETEVLVQIALDYLKMDNSEGISSSLATLPQAGAERVANTPAEIISTPLDPPLMGGELMVSDQKSHDYCPYKKVLEIGTGTGAVALSLAKEADCKVTATDINKKALDLALRNACEHKLDGVIDFLESKIYEKLPEEKYDLIVSNPPYISEALMKHLPEEVKREPEIALYGGKEGLDSIVVILKESHRFLKKHGAVILEISPEQGSVVVDFANKCGFTSNLVEDLGGTKRFLKAVYGNYQNKKEQL